MDTLGSLSFSFHWYRGVGIKYKCRKPNDNAYHHLCFYCDWGLLFNFKFCKRHKGVNRELNRYKTIGCNKYRKSNFSIKIKKLDFYHYFGIVPFSRMEMFCNLNGYQSFIVYLFCFPEIQYFKGSFYFHS